jgi:hypothetical protein
MCWVLTGQTAESKAQAHTYIFHTPPKPRLSNSNEREEHDYCGTLAVSTLIILFIGMLKFSKKEKEKNYLCQGTIFCKAYKIFWNNSREYSNFQHGVFKIINYWTDVCALKLSLYYPMLGFFHGKSRGRFNFVSFILKPQTWLQRLLFRPAFFFH